MKNRFLFVFLVVLLPNHFYMMLTPCFFGFFRASTSTEAATATLPFVILQLTHRRKRSKSGVYT
jgi:hypothetical protein